MQTLECASASLPGLCTSACLQHLQTFACACVCLHNHCTCTCLQHLQTYACDCPVTGLAHACSTCRPLHVPSQLIVAWPQLSTEDLANQAINLSLSRGYCTACCCNWRGRLAPATLLPRLCWLCWWWWWLGLYQRTACLLPAFLCCCCCQCDPPGGGLKLPPFWALQQFDGTETNSSLLVW